MTRIPRRTLLERIGPRLRAATAVAVGLGPTGSGPALQTDREPDYPDCVYQPDDDGDWRVTMPINLHVTVPGTRRALTAIEAEFTGLENARWIPFFPDATTGAWDPTVESLVGPDYSVRRPRLGEGWTHVHVWEIDSDHAAVHAHLDVIDREYDYCHRGDHYDVAARRVREQLSSDWRRERPYSIEYGVDEDKREDWGETGETKLEYVAG